MQSIDIGIEVRALKDKGYDNEYVIKWLTDRYNEAMIIMTTLIEQEIGKLYRQKELRDQPKVKILKQDSGV